MWARLAESMMGVWLIASPFVFRGTAFADAFTAIDIVAGTCVVVFSALSFWRRTRWAHLMTALLALGLGGYAYLAWERPGPPAAQNEIVVCLLLLLFAIVPNEASRPPTPWRRGAGV